MKVVLPSAGLRQTWGFSLARISISEELLGNLSLSKIMKYFLAIFGDQFTYLKWVAKSGYCSLENNANIGLLSVSSRSALVF